MHLSRGGGEGNYLRADRLTYEYEKKLWEYDSRFHGAELRPDGRRRGQQEVQPGRLGLWWPDCGAMALSAKGSW